MSIQVSLFVLVEFKTSTKKRDREGDKAAHNELAITNNARLRELNGL